MVNIKNSLYGVNAMHNFNHIHFDDYPKCFDL